MTNDDIQKITELRDACDAALKGEPIEYNAAPWEDGTFEGLLSYCQFRPKPKPIRIWIEKRDISLCNQSPVPDAIEFVQVMK